MKLERAALIAEILGGFAVVISVVYLAIQLSDNNRLLRSQAHYNALALAQRPFEILIETETLSALLLACGSDPRGVEENIWARCSNYYYMQANGWEYLYYQHEDDAIPPELWVGADGYFTNEAKTNAGWVRFWEETAIGFGEPFRSYIHDRVSVNSAYVNKTNQKTGDK